MKLNLDRTFRVVWLAVGGLILLVLVVGAVLVAAQWIGNRGASDDAVRIANQAQPSRKEARAVRYGAPRALRGTSTRLVLVGNGEGYESSDVYGSYDSRGRDAWINVVFLDGAGAARLLLDRPAYIRDVGAPTLQPPADSLQTWITYVMALDDDDRSGKLDHEDTPGLYVTDLEGRNLRPVVRPPLRYVSHQAMEGGRMLVYALEPPAGQPRVDARRMRQRAFVYDVAAGTLSPYAALDSAVARAAQAVGR